MFVVKIYQTLIRAWKLIIYADWFSFKINETSIFAIGRQTSQTERLKHYNIRPESFWIQHLRGAKTETMEFFFNVNHYTLA